VVLSALAKLIGSSLAPSGENARLSILMYHRVLREPDPLMHTEMHATYFDAQIHALTQYFRCLPLAEAIRRLREGTLPSRAACITFDDGYRDNVDVALPILRKHGVPAIFFIATGYLNGGRMFNDTVIEAIRRAPSTALDLSNLGASRVPLTNVEERRAAIWECLRVAKYMSPQERTSFVTEIARQAGAQLPDDLMMDSRHLSVLIDAGMEIGAHTISHPILNTVTDAEARQEIVDSKARLESLTGREIALFAYPNGIPGRDYNSAHVSMVREAGFRAAVSTSWGVSTRSTDCFQLPRFTPWDRTPLRFTARMLHNCAVNRPSFA